MANILIVEDESIIVEDLRGKLRHLGHTVAGTAATGQDAIERAAATNPDLALMDVRLRGDMDGIEAARQIRETHRIPIIYVTAHPTRFLKNPTLMQEPYMCLTKPFSLESLESVLTAALANHAPN